MRWSTLIYAIFTFFLAIEPGLKSMLHQSSNTPTCCNASCKEVSEAKDATETSDPTDTCNQTCNPFEVCSACVLDCLPNALGLVKLPSYFPKHYVVLEAGYMSAGFTEFWQPPKCA